MLTKKAEIETDARKTEAEAGARAALAYAKKAEMELESKKLEFELKKIDLEILRQKRSAVDTELPDAKRQRFVPLQPCILFH